MQNSDENKPVISQKPTDNSGIKVDGHIKIWDPDSKEVFVNKRNAVHYENLSEALAKMLANRGQGFIHEMHFGNGGSTVDTTGLITYLPPNTTGANANLYNPTFYKVVDDTSTFNTNPLRNKLEVRHISGQFYTDILVTCLLDYGEPTNQDAFDTSTNFNGNYVFDELGLKSWAGSPATGKLLTHVIFHPVQKSLNRLIQIDYTLRIQTLTNFVSTT